MPTPRGGRKMPGTMCNEAAQQDVKDADHPIGGRYGGWGGPCPP